MKKEIRFTAKNKTEVLIKPITAKVAAEAQLVYNKAFKDALKAGSLLKSGLEPYMREQGLWNDDRQKEYEEVLKTISDYDKQLNSGLDTDGNKLKLTQAKEIALGLSKARKKLTKLIHERSILDSNTAESIADNARFNFFVVNSCYDYKTQSRLFESVDDYLEKGEDEFTIEVASKFAEVFYDVDPDYEKNLTEFKFLKRFNFIDDEGYFINREGQRVDLDGNVVTVKEDKDDSSVDVLTAEFEDDVTPKPKKVTKKTKE